MHTKSILESIINKGMEYRNLTQNDDYYIEFYKLNMLAYIAHGLSLSLYDRPLIDGNILASKSGPYLKEAEDIFFEWELNPITKIYNPIPAPPSFDDIIDIVVKKFGTMERRKLVHMCK